MTDTAAPSTTPLTSAPCSVASAANSGLLETLLETGADALCGLDRDGRLTYVNGNAERLFGACEALLGRPFRDVLLPGGAVESYEARLTEALAGGRPIRFEAPSPVAQDRWLQVDARPCAGGVAIACRDITEQRSAELHRGLLGEVREILDASPAYEATLLRVAETVSAVLGASCVIELLEEGETLHTVAVAGARFEVLEPALPRSLSGDLEDPATRVVRTGETVPIEAPVQRDAAGGSPPARPAHGPGVAVPIAAQGHLLGVLTLTCDRSRPFDDREVGLAQEIGRLVGTAVRGGRLHVQAHEATQTKSVFLAVMSHELRSPLSTIIGYADLLLMGLPEPLPEAACARVERIRLSAWHLFRLIEEILAFSRLETGREELYPQDVDLADVVKHSASLIEPVAREKGLGFAVRLPPATPVLRTDASKLKRILLHLLTNAVKFTAQGEIGLELECVPGQVCFHVRDTGAGIPPERREQIFRPFWQMDPMDEGRLGGIGLGLSISRSLARFLGGEIALDSVAGQGSTFSLILPAEPGAAGA